MINESLFSNPKKSNSRTNSDFESSKFEGLIAIAEFKAADFMKIEGNSRCCCKVAEGSKTHRGLRLSFSLREQWDLD